MRLRNLTRLFSTRRYRRLPADFRTPLRALIAASGVFRRRFRLVTRSDAIMDTDRGDLPIWQEYFAPQTCRVEVEEGLFRITPNDSTYPAYRIAGGSGCLTFHPQRWNPDAYHSPLARRLEAAEKSVYSELLSRIPTVHRYVVEFGAYDGCTMSNSRDLIVNAGWSALLIEGDPRFYRALHARYRDNPRVVTYKTLVTPENINALFARAGVPPDFEVLSIDVDSIDYYLWQALTDFSPKIVIIEYNASIPPDREYVVPPDEALRLSGTSREGASILSFYRLGREKGYSLVYSELSGANLFFVHDSCRPFLDLVELSPAELYQPPQYGLLAGGAAPNGRGYPTPTTD
jgi:hypothetical protein